MTVNQLTAAGRLDTRVGLLRPTTEVTVTGAHVKAYEKAATVWANVRQITLRESMRANVELQSETYTVLIRYRAGLTPDWCVELRGRRYRIMNLNVIPEQGQIILGIELDNSITQEVTT